MSFEMPDADSSSHGPAATLECRVYERQPCDIPTKCHPVSVLDMKEAGWHAAICDLSQGGLRLRLKRRFERGTGLAIELPGDDQHEPATVFVKVVHLHAEDGGEWSLGCKFVSELSEDEIHRLLTSKRHILSADPTPACGESDEERP